MRSADAAFAAVVLRRLQAFDLDTARITPRIGAGTGPAAIIERV